MERSATDTFDRLLSFSIVAFAAVFVAWVFVPGLGGHAIHHSDMAFHLSILASLDLAITEGGSPLDFWFDSTPFGFALFRSYQNLPYLVVYGVYRLFGRAFSLDECMMGSMLVVGAALPISVFLSLRILGVERRAAAFAALCSCLVAEKGDYGLGLQNYTFGTGGIFTQAWSAAALPPAIAFSIRFLHAGTGFAPALFFIFVCFGSHVLAAFVIFSAILSYLLVRLPSFSKELCARAFFLGSGTITLTAYQWLFTVSDGRYINRSVIEPAWKYASHGLRWTISSLVDGGLFDHGRLPILTALVAVGLAAAIFPPPSTLLGPRASALPGWALLSFFLLLALLCGWDVWGFLFRDTPLLRSLHMHRFILGVHIIGTFLIALGVEASLTLFPRSKVIQSLLLLLLIFSLSPIFDERLKRFSDAHEWRRKAETAYANDADLQKALTFLEAKPRAFVHPGMKQNWQERIKLADMVPLHYLVLARGFPTLGGMLYHAFSLAGDAMFDFDADRQATYDLFGVGYVLAPVDTKFPAFLTEEVRFGRYKVLSYRTKRLMIADARFRLEGARADEPSFMRRWVSSNLPERRVFGFVSGGDPDLPRFPLAGAAPRLSAGEAKGTIVEESEWRQSGVRGVVDMKRAAHVVMKTGYHPGWIARVDGIQTTTDWLTPGFVAVAVGPGRHSVEFEYRGSKLKEILFGLSLMVMGGLGAMSFLRSDRV